MIPLPRRVGDMLAFCIWPLGFCARGVTRGVAGLWHTLRRVSRVDW